MKIEDICTRVCSGGTPKSGNAEYYENGAIPWLNTKEINFNRIQATETFITEEGLSNSPAKWIKPHAVIVAMYGATAGRVAVTEIPLTTNQACCNLEVDETIADYRYVYYWLKQNFDNIAGLANGGAQQNLNAKVIRQIEINLPDLIKQRSIANFLDSLDSKIETNAKLNGYLEELVDALFCEMVLAAVDSSKTVSFSSFLEERKEKCLSRTNAEYSVTDTGIHPRSLKFRKNLSATSSKNKIARKDDLVFGISRRILNWGLFDAEIGEVSSAYRVYSISDVPPEYVARYIARYQYAFTDIIKPSSREGQGIMPGALMAKKLPKLNYFAWEKYLDSVAPIKALASITRTETAALLESRDSILPKLMSGEIDVSEIDPTQLNSHLA